MLPCFSKLSLLQNILVGEEKEAFLKSVSSPHLERPCKTAPDSSPCRHPLVVTHNQAVYQKGLVRCASNPDSYHVMMSKRFSPTCDGAKVPRGQPSSKLMSERLRA